MTQQQDFKGELRATYTMRLLENAKCSVQTSTTGGLFMRVTLAVIYMYLIFISYLMLGIAGPVFTSTLFLVALFTPYCYRVSKDHLENRRALKVDLCLGQKSRQEG
ncbi:MAG: hypothetical protein WBN08_07730 [Thiogranum sp.]